jgi:hypothetical protein
MKIRSMLRLAVAGLALLMSAAAARAFSDDAVKDAQKLVDFTNNRFQAGTARQSDVAVARYNLLYMRLRAGQLSHAAFCRAAKPELQRAADRPEEPAGQAGEKPKWQREVAAMMSSPAACDRAVATANALLFGFEDRAYSPDEVKAAEDRANLMEQRVATGTASRRDAVRAHYDVLAAKYGAKLIPRKEYCDEGLPDLHAIVDMVERRLQSGDSNQEDVIVSRRDVFRLEALCGAK